ncbi:MAG TPA: ScyD/ScyE family protein [Pyrinomonadaceae bacterium]|nr:ScyD/ScyE family protein [Pyrinomonadaceae bacterium]
MKGRNIIKCLVSVRFSLLAAATLSLTVSQASAQCPVTGLTSGLQLPLGIAQTNQDNLLISESGPRGTTNTGRIDIVGLDGTRRTLLDGLPSGSNDVGDPSGPAGLFMRGRTLYVAIGLGDVVVGVGIPGAAIANPSPSSPIFSSVLAIHFSANVEKTIDDLAPSGITGNVPTPCSDANGSSTQSALSSSVAKLPLLSHFTKTSTTGFTLSLANHQALANGERVRLSNGSDKITIELVADFPNYIPNPIPPLPNNVRASNPYDLVGVDDQLYVTDGGRNLVWKVNIDSGSFSALAEFPPVANPLFNPNPPPPPSIGGPTVEAVPTGIEYVDGQLLVTLFRGFPFPAGTSVVEQIDPVTGAHAAFISGLRTAVDIIAIREGGDTDYLVLQHSAAGGAPLPPFNNPGRLLRFEEPGAAPTVIAEGANCLARPTSMKFDEETGTLYVTEYGGRVVAIPIE